MITVPAGIIGWNLNKGLFVWLRSLWARSMNPACPECNRGVMVRERLDGQAAADREPLNIVRSQPLPWACTHCGYAVLEATDSRRVREAVASRRQDRAQALFSAMQWQDRRLVTIRHRTGARVFYAFALLTFVRCIYMLATGVPPIVTLDWASFSLMFCVLALKKAYRAWQVTTGHLFEQGAFWYWFRHEKWLG